MREGVNQKTRRNTRRLPMDPIKEALADRRVWTALGIVKVFDGQASHYEIFQDDDGETDILVDVELAHSGEPLLCRLAAPAGGALFGVWAIPPVGTEVVVVVPFGEYEEQPVIVACYSSGNVPAEVNDDQVLVVTRPKVRIIATGGDVHVEARGGHNILLDDGSGAQALAYKSDVQALVTTFNAHVHPVPALSLSGLTAGGSPTTVPSSMQSGVAGPGTTTTTGPASAPVGTSVVKGK